MRRYKFFWIVNLSACVALVTGCASVYPEQFFQKRSEMLKSFEGSIYNRDVSLLSGTNDSPVLNEAASKKLYDGVKGKMPEETVKFLFQTVCSGNKQAQEVRNHVRLVVPFSIPGTPVDRAADDRREFLEQAREAIKQFYWLGSTVKVPESDKLSDPKSYWHRGSLAEYFIGLPKNDLIGTFKTAYLPRDYVYMKKNYPVLPPGDMIFIRDGDFGPFFLVNRGWSTIAKVSPRYVSAYCGETSALGSCVSGTQIGSFAVEDFSDGERLEIEYIESNERPREYFFSIAKSPVTLSAGRHLKQEDWRIERHNLFPLAAIQLDVMRILRHWFVLLVPEDVQRSIFKDESGNAKVLESRSGRPFGYKENGRNISVEEAVQDKEAAWRAYFNAMTTVKEAPSSDPQVIDFEVSLDLNPFCAYGRSVTEVLTQ